MSAVKAPVRTIRTQQSKASAHCEQLKAGIEAALAGGTKPMRCGSPHGSASHEAVDVNDASRGGHWCDLSCDQSTSRSPTQLTHPGCI
jgi:hypothetical protein